MSITRIFITGCARSGTTLLNRLFYAFNGIAVVDPEISLEDFRSRAVAEHILVGKRTPQTILSVPLPEEELLNQAEILSSSDIGILNMIRDGRDVVHEHSTGPRVNINRWIGCVLQAQRFRKLVTLQVRYEDLVTFPDGIQAQIAQVFQLDARVAFSKYPEFVSEEVFDVPDYRGFRPYRKRPIDQTSIGQSRTEYADLCSSDEERALFERILSRLGYLGGVHNEVWDPEELEQDQELFKTMSKELGYECA